MKYNFEQLLKYLCFIILGYFIAMIFSRMCSCGGNGFNIGAVEDCSLISIYNCGGNNPAYHCKWDNESQLCMENIFEEDIDGAIQLFEEHIDGAI